MTDPNFELLPTELKILILFRVSDNKSLKSLVFASPGYHKAYLAVRQELLQNIIAREYDVILDQAEVLAAVRSKGLYFDEKKDEAIALLDIWRRRDELRALPRQSATRPLEPDGLDEIFQILSFYRVVDFFLEDVLMNAPKPPWMEPDQWKSHLPLTLSLPEKRRFARALCRLQIMKNLFSEPVVGQLAQVCDPSAHESYFNSWDLAEREEIDGEMIFPTDTAWRLLYGTMPPWEYDEMGSVFGYLLYRIHTVAEEISDDLRKLAKDTPDGYFWDIVPKEERPEGLTFGRAEHLESFPRYYEGLAALGPEFLCRALRADRLSRRNIICENASRNTGSGAFIGMSTPGSSDVRFPFTDPADNLNEPQDFNQSWSKLLPHQRPSEGWKKAWMLPNCEGNTLEGSIDMNRAREEDWNWCYALWDESRLREWKAPLLDRIPGNAGNLALVVRSTAPSRWFGNLPPSSF